MVRGIRDDLAPIHRRARHRAPACLFDQIVLGREMAVEAAMRQVGGFHNVGHADAAETLATKQRARRIDDAFTIFGGLLPAYSHGFLTWHISAIRRISVMRSRGAA